MNYYRRYISLIQYFSFINNISVGEYQKCVLFINTLLSILNRSSEIVNIHKLPQIYIKNTQVQDISKFCIAVEKDL